MISNKYGSKAHKLKKLKRGSEGEETLKGRVLSVIVTEFASLNE
ncbi:hypothetical protein Hanom_Chr12g01099811 [Helianthus anomalus]